jgi:flavin reductase (DIM6/NTAB) family NADH-FMN oxidoreductase RutF
MWFDMSLLDQKRSYKLLTATVVPRPIAWVVTQSADGKTNAAPFSFFNFFSGFPPVVCVGIGNRPNGQKDSLNNILATKQFVINMVSDETVEAMNTTSTAYPPEVDELAMADLEVLPSQKVKPPRIAKSPVALECELSQVIDLDQSNTGSIVIATVVAMHIADDAVINPEKCYIDTPKLKLVGRMESPGWYVHTTDRFFLPTPGPVTP